MKLLYISHLRPNVADGLSWSVPASVNAQNKYDDVFWLNVGIGEGILDHWKDVPVFNHYNQVYWDYEDYLPDNYMKPDIVIFEGFYDKFIDVIWGWKLKHRRIPYIIIPRSALTETAMNNHARIKKIIAHKLIYNHHISNASALHLLTEGEAKSTLKHFCKRSVIIPNGISTPSCYKKSFSKDVIKVSYIGRIAANQKGLDLLFDAILKMKEFLISNNFELHIYGPENQDYSMLKTMAGKMSIESLVTFHEQVFGKKKEDVLLDTDVFIMTSRFEGLPMGLIEALSYGVPCAVTDGTYLDKEISEYNAGWTTKTSVEGIVYMLKSICTQKASYEEKGANARKLSLNYNWDSIAKKTHEEYLKLIEK